MHRSLKEKRMQEQPTGYGQTPQWSGQQQPNTSGQQWNQQPYTPYPQLQEFAPQQQFPPQQGQFQHLFPESQYNQQPNRQPTQTPTPPEQPNRK
jgi:hypothetical protein